MKAATLYHLALGLIIACLFLFGFAFLPTQVRAEDNDYSQTSGQYSQEELAQMLAPIALYPDNLLSQILMASTYPIEIIEADRWRKKNRHLQDEPLDDALADEFWDPSVKALCHFPDILNLMSERIGETTDLGNAFLVQEEQVMDTVQELRAAAYAQGNLNSSDRQKVVVEKETIIIEPADPRIIYVPYYNPVTIYGRWWYPAYSPYYWGPPGVKVGFGIGYWPGFYFSFSYGNWSIFNWHRRYVHIDIHKRPRYVHHHRWHTQHGRWHHTPIHRRGVAYRDNSTARKYGQAPRTVHYRRNTRGFPQRQELDRRERSIDGTRRQVDRQRVNRQKMDQQRINRQHIDRSAQPRQRVETNRHRGTMTPTILQPSTREDTSRSIRNKIERDRKKRDQITEETRQRRRINHSERKKMQQVRTERNRKARQPAVKTRQQQKRIEQTKPQHRMEDQQRRLTRDNAFNRVDQGVKERRSSERGRSSWQKRTGNARENSGTMEINRDYRVRNRR